MITMSGRPARYRRAALSLIELLIVVAIIGVLVGILLPAVQRVRESASRAKCQNNLHQIGLGLHQYNEQQGTLPPGHRSSVGPDVMPFSGWPLSALPYLEHQSLYDISVAAYQTASFPFNDPPHIGLSTVVLVFACPSDGRVAAPKISQKTQLRVAFTSYLGVSGRDYSTKDGVLFQDSHVSLRDVSDGLSQTLLIGERPPSADFQFGWWYAGIGQNFTGSGDMILGVNEQNVRSNGGGAPCNPGAYFFRPGTFADQCGMFHFWSPHSGGANFAFADGSVHFLPYEAASLLPALATRAGGEPAELP